MFPSKIAGDDAIRETESSIKREAEVQKAKRETKGNQTVRVRSKECRQTWSPRARWIKVVTRRQHVNLELQQLLSIGIDFVWLGGLVNTKEQGWALQLF